MNLTVMTIYAKKISFNKQYLTRVFEYFFIITHHLFIFSIFAQLCFFLLEYSDFVRTSKSYTIFQNETKRRRIENRNAFNIFNDDNINLFNNNSNSLYDFTIIHNDFFQNVIFYVNNRFLSKDNRRGRVADFKNQFLLSSSSMWFQIVYVDANIIEIKFKKFKKFANDDKFANSKIKTFTRFSRQSRAERYTFFFFSSCNLRVDRNVLKKNKLQKKKFFSNFELRFCWMLR